jgi:hypothetical protein
MPQVSGMIGGDLVPLPPTFLVLTMACPSLLDIPAGTTLPACPQWGEPWQYQRGTSCCGTLLVREVKWMSPSAWFTLMLVVKCPVGHDTAVCFLEP